MSRMAEIIREAELLAEQQPSRAKAILAPKKVKASCAPMPAFPQLQEPITLTALGSSPMVMPGANLTEAAYGAELERKKFMGEVLRWWWQPLSLRLTFQENGTGVYYRPDFLVQLPSLQLEIHETKGFMREDARDKLKLASSIYPFRFILVKRIKGTWTLDLLRGALP